MSGRLMYMYQAATKPMIMDAVALHLTQVGTWCAASMISWSTKIEPAKKCSMCSTSWKNMP
ncbi:hypothetical protein D3C87_1885270 [compost metagenome]